jgi:hypothetical protein
VHANMARIHIVPWLALRKYVAGDMHPNLTKCDDSAAILVTSFLDILRLSHVHLRIPAAAVVRPCRYVKRVVNWAAVLTNS